MGSMQTISRGCGRKCLVQVGLAAVSSRSEFCKTVRLYRKSLNIVHVIMQYLCNIPSLSIHENLRSLEENTNKVESAATRSYCFASSSKSFLLPFAHTFAGRLKSSFFT